MIKKRRFFKKKKKSKKQKNFNKFFSYRAMERIRRNFTYKDFSNSNSIHSSFTESIFDYAKFYNATIKYCGFKNCKFSWIEFKRCNFRGSRFRGAIFENVIFRDCNLKKVDFLGATFKNVVFINTSFKEVKNLKDNKDKIITKNKIREVQEMDKLISFFKNQFNIDFDKVKSDLLLRYFSYRQITNTLTTKGVAKLEFSYIAKVVKDNN